MRQVLDIQASGGKTPQITRELMSAYEQDFYEQIFDGDGNILDEYEPTYTAKWFNSGKGWKGNHGKIRSRFWEGIAKAMFSATLDFCPFWGSFWRPFGSDWEAGFPTILTLGGPVMPNRDHVTTT